MFGLSKKKKGAVVVKLKNDTQVAPLQKIDKSTENIKMKQEINIYLSQIEKLLKNPQNAKKAAMLLSDMLREPNRKK